MSPSADPASVEAPVSVEVSSRLLNDGEIVQLAIKPGLGFVVLASLPTLAVLAVVAGLFWVLQEAIGVSLGVSARSATWICAGGAAARLLLSCMEWSSRLYCLTNRRVFRVQGVFCPNVEQCPLQAINRVDLTAGGGEKALGMATLRFRLTDGRGDGPDWVNVARPEEVARIVREALLRSH